MSAEAEDASKAQPDRRARPTETPLKPTVLLVTSSKWVPTARLGMAMAHAGFHVDAVCPEGHPITRTSALRTGYPYSGLTAARSIATGIISSQPDLVIPCDDLASLQLHRLYAAEHKRAAATSPICAVLARSLGNPTNFPMLYERATFIEMAANEGVRVPKMTVVSSLDEMRKWAINVGDTGCHRTVSPFSCNRTRHCS